MSTKTGEKDSKMVKIVLGGNSTGVNIKNGDEIISLKYGVPVEISQEFYDKAVVKLQKSYNIKKV